MRKFVAALCVVCIGSTATGAEAVATITGVASVEDGDGILFGNVEVRLQGIAAPELSERMGPESYQFLSELVEGKTVACELDGTTAGKSRRPVGICFVDGLDIGRLQVEAGLARDCPNFSKGRYRDAEAAAVNSGKVLSVIYKLPSYCD